MSTTAVTLRAAIARRRRRSAFSSAMAVMAPMGVRAATHRVDRELDIDGSCLLEGQRSGEAFALLGRALQVHEHDVVGARRELDLAAGGNFDALGERAHGHDAL